MPCHRWVFSPLGVKADRMGDFATMLWVTAAAGAATGLGALPVLWRSSFSHRTYDTALGLASGIMIGASVFGLILPGMEEGTLTAVMVGVLVGGIVLLVANRLLPHVHAVYLGWRGHGEDAPTLDEASPWRRAILVGGAITLHNAPEGLAMGVAFASGLEEVAFVLAVIIAMQNVPDGFAFAVPLGVTPTGRLTILVLTTLSGLVPQVAAAVFGFAVVALATGIFPVAAGFAAGAMIAVVFRELVPMSHGHGYADAATAAFLVGFSLIVVVDTVLAV